MNKQNFFNDTDYTPFGRGITIADYMQQLDRKSFDRHLLSIIIPTIGGIPIHFVKVV